MMLVMPEAPGVAPTIRLLLVEVGIETVFSASVILAIMILPIIAAISREILRQVVPVQVYGAVWHELGDAHCLGAQEKTRTSTTLRPQVPEPCASTNSATWASMGTPRPAVSRHR